MKIKVSELKEMLNSLDDDVEIKFYVNDCEYDEEGLDMGYAYLDKIGESGTVYLKTNYWEGKFGD